MASVINTFGALNDTSLLYAFEMRLSRLQDWVDALKYNSETLKKGVMSDKYGEWFNYTFDIMNLVKILKISHQERIKNIENGSDFQIPNYIDNNLMTTYGKDFAKPFKFLFNDKILLSEHTQNQFSGLLLKTRAMSIHLRFLQKYLIVRDEQKNKFESISNWIQQSIEMFELIITTAIYKEIAFKHILGPQDNPDIIGPLRKYPSNNSLLYSDKIILDNAMITINEYIKAVDHIPFNEYTDLFATGYEDDNFKFDPSIDVFKSLLICINDTWDKCKYFLKT